uniref:Uncharacterized protein n=1 Tax=Cucumis melo TaxID=3656 RepID=A0A9I9EN30_CUCME
MNKLFSLSRNLASRLSNSFPTPTLDIDHSRSPSFAEKIYGFFSVPAAGKRFIFNISNTLFRKGLKQIGSELKLAFDHQWGGRMTTKFQDLSTCGVLHFQPPSVPFSEYRKNFRTRNCMQNVTKANVNKGPLLEPVWKHREAHSLLGLNFRLDKPRVDNS